jgi:hypothetical protein
MNEDDPIEALVESHRAVEALRIRLRQAESRLKRDADRASLLFEHNHWPDAVFCKGAVVRTDHDWQDGPRIEVIDVSACPHSDSLVGLDLPRPETLQLARTA